MTNLAEIQAVAEQNHISPDGFTPSKCEPDGIQCAFWAENHAREVDLARAFLRSGELPRRKRLQSSYALKHAVEQWRPGSYVSNGAFIVAAILEGLKPTPIGINALFRVR